jgi:hypothetical protein
MQGSIPQSADNVPHAPATGPTSAHGCPPLHSVYTLVLITAYLLGSIRSIHTRYQYVIAVHDMNRQRQIVYVTITLPAAVYHTPDLIPSHQAPEHVMLQNAGVHTGPRTSQPSTLCTANGGLKNKLPGTEQWIKRKHSINEQCGHP